MRIYAPRRLVLSGQPPLVALIPFWGFTGYGGDPDEGTSKAIPNVFGRYARGGKHLFKLTNLAEADVAVFPVAWEYVEGSQQSEGFAHELAEEAKSAGKPLVIFYNSDSSAELPIDNAIVFRTSLFASKRRPGEFAMPAWSEDHVEHFLGGELSLRNKCSKPRVSFMGFAAPVHTPLKARLRNWKKQAGRLVRRKPLQFPWRSYPGGHIRARALRGLQRSPHVESNFRLFDQFYAVHAKTPEARQQRRFEFVANMVEGDYVLCVRGAGNFSYRLYEALSCGRIPLLVNTDCVLPYDFEIDWRDYCVWVEASELPDIGERLWDFHSSLTPQDFIDLQKACRKLWEDRIAPLGFFTHFRRHFDLLDERQQDPWLQDQGILK